MTPRDTYVMFSATFVLLNFFWEVGIFQPYNTYAVKTIKSSSLCTVILTLFIIVLFSSPNFGSAE